MHCGQADEAPGRFTIADHINGGLDADYVHAIDNLTPATDTTLPLFDPCNR
jgi:hypothetical protein